MKSEKIKVLMIGPDRTVHGGISGVVNGYFDAGLANKVDLKYIGTMKEGSKIKKLAVAGFAYLRFLFALNWADVVHVHVASDNSFLRKALFIKAAHKHHKKIIIHQHGGDFINWYESSNKSRQNMIRDVLNMADKMLVIAPYLACFTEGLIAQEKIILFPDTIDCKEFDCDVEEERSNIITFMGRICKTKGIEELFECFPNIIKCFPDVKLLLAGVFEEEALKEKMITLGKNVEYLGWVCSKEKASLLSKTALFVMPSYFEGQSLAILEAMASGCCVVASNVGGIPMMVHSGENGILVPPQDADALGNEIKNLLNNKKKMKKYSLEAKRTAFEEYDIHNTIDKLIEIYTSII